VGNLASVHFSSLREQEGGRWSLELKLKSNLRDKHGTLRLPIYTKGTLRTDHVCTCLISVSDYKLLRRKL